MDAIQFLSSQHDEVEALFSSYQALEPRTRSARAELVQQLCEALTIHTRIEHDVFYPAFKRATREKGLVLEFLEEHHLVAILLKQLSNLDADDETYDAKVKVLKALVLQHVFDEQNKMFPLARQAFERQALLKLGSALEEETRQLKAQEPHLTIAMLRQTRLETPR